MGVVGKGGTCCFMCVVGVAVLWGLRLSGCGWCDNLILARAGAFPDGKGRRSGFSEDSKRSLRERPMWLVFRDGTELVGFVWFGFSHAVTRYAEMVCRVTVSFNLF